MKGKSKSNNSTSANNNDGEEEECHLQFPDFKPVDHARVCPRYTSVLTRQQSEAIGPEELDTLQSELETLLSSAAKRMKLLEEEKTTLTLWQEKGDIKKAPSKSKDLKRMASPVSTERPSKKAKVEKKKAVKIEPVEEPETTTTIPKIPRNETPLKFWRTVDMYCGDFNGDHLKTLEDIIRSLSDQLDYYKVPALGKHYSEKWAIKDLENEKSKTDKDKKKRLGEDFTPPEDREPEILMKNLQANEEDDPFQPLTKLLVQSLLDDPEALSILNEPMSDDVDISEAPTVTTKSLAKQVNINMGSALSLERRIKRELTVQDLLSKETENRNGVSNSPSNGDLDDEILKELQEKQSLLKSLTDKTLKQTRRLYKLAKAQMQIQQLRNKKNNCDQNVIDSYNKILSIRSKKKSPSKKEKEGVIKCLKQRQAIVDNLNESKRKYNDLLRNTETDTEDGAVMTNGASD